MLPLEIENIIYSYHKDLECLKYKEINEELTEVLLLCRECDEYKLTMMRCKICSDDYCISCTYKNHYYINGKEYFNNHEIHCLPCHSSWRLGAASILLLRGALENAFWRLSAASQGFSHVGAIGRQRGQVADRRGQYDQSGNGKQLHFS